MRVRQFGQIQSLAVQQGSRLTPILINHRRRLIVVDDMQEKKSSLELARHQRGPVECAIGAG
jgi:hypothetical protein